MLRRSTAVVSGLFAFATILPLLCAQQNDNPVPICISVVDPSGAAVPSARVTVARGPQDVRFSKKETDASGKLPVTLPPGSYDVTVTGSGFSKTVEHLEVASNSPSSLQIGLAASSYSGLEVTTVAPPPLDVDMESGKRQTDLPPSKADAKKCEGCGCGSQSH